MEIKEWFSHKYGCVNLDSNTIYFTNSGNWSETKELKEKSRKVDNTNHWNNLWTYGFVIIAIVFFLFIIFAQFINGKLKISFLVLLLGLGYKMYEYMKNDLGPNFKIPINKIKKIVIQDAQFTILFVNGELRETSHQLMGLDAKGINILTVLQSKIIE